MRVLFSHLHATHKRPEKAVAAMRLTHERASNPQASEYIFCVNEDDPTFPELIAQVQAAEKEMRFARTLVHIGPVRSSAPAWNEAAKLSEGEILIQAQDDVEPPHHWDSELINRLVATAENWPETPTFIAVGDGYRKDRLCCTAIMNRAYFERDGYFLFPGYESVYSDGDVTFRAYKHQRAGTAALVEARDLVFLHRHHYHDKTVPNDATYEKENSPSAYSKGYALFRARNPDAEGNAIIDW